MKFKLTNNKKEWCGKTLFRIEATTVLLTDDTTPLLGEVAAVGVKAEKEGYRSGSVVMFNRFSGTDFEHDGRKFKAITSTDILKIL